MKWTVVVPVKDAGAGKSRLGAWLDAPARVDLARAMALDTIAAVAACQSVGSVWVVTADPVVSVEAVGLPDAVAPVEVLGEPNERGTLSGLNAAVAAGVVAACGAVLDGAVAALLGDLPALRPSELESALVAAGRRARAFVPDAAGTGTTLLTAGPGVGLAPRFGPGSAAAHAALGYEALAGDQWPSLRLDVDLPGDLEAARALGLGPRTAAAVRRLPITS
ncbi:MAG: 2-phospho-L-lactate guanylyltransferase [Bifidobacteriaceae bacterium]|jgi:2-phospho-L-lactate guanylyltransferase|nr:2-phospho-L-lactate guanylyltransferase [Bifidobacteriaceae bacterium]